MRSPLQYYGSDNLTAQRIAAMYPRKGCEVFVEGCAGSAAVTFHRQPVGNRILNDLNPDIARFWNTVQSNGRDLAILYEALEPSRELWERNEVEYKGEALQTLIRHNMSRDGAGQYFGWVRSCNLSTKTIVCRLIEAQRHLQGAYISNVDVLKIIGAYNAPTVHMYIDPPFHHSSRIKKYRYAIEQGDDWHRQFLLQCCESRAKIVISGYRCDLYDALLTQWRRTEIEQRVRAGSSRRYALECFWSNF